MSKSLLLVQLLTLCATLRIAEAATNYAFLSLGDWGGAQLDAQTSTNVNTVAAAMANTATAVGAKFIINVGDNFYWCGIENSTDPQIQVDYVTPYSLPALNMKWYNTLGNHEYGYSVQAQIDYMKLNPNWILPNRYYTQRLQLDATNFMTILVLDTSPCVSDYRNDNRDYWDPCSTEYPTCSQHNSANDDFEGPCYFHENILGQNCGVQYSWLQATLWGIPETDWLVVVGHHPLDEVNVKDMTTLIQQRGFSVYLNGHTHTMNFYQLDGAGAWVTTGAAAMVNVPTGESSAVDTQDQKHPITKRKREGKDVTKEHRHAYRNVTKGQEGTYKNAQEGLQKTYDDHSYKQLWGKTVAAFTMHQFNSDFSQLTTQFIDYTGTVIYQFVVNKAGDLLSHGVPTVATQYTNTTTVNK